MEFLKCQNFSQIFRCHVGPSSNAQWIKYWNARFFIKRIFCKISSKTHSQKFLVGNIFQETTWKIPWGFFLEGAFWKTISNLPWGSFLENNLKSPLSDFFGKHPQIFLEGLLWKRTWYLPWWKTTSNLPWWIFLIYKNLISSLRERKKNILASHFRNR